MPKIEETTSLTLYAQWKLYPFPAPQIPEQKSANSKWAVSETTKTLEIIIEQFQNIKIIQKHNGKVQLNIPDPEAKLTNDISLWEAVISNLQKAEQVEYITVDVNNDISERIAINKADYIRTLWNAGYQGFHKETIIYHK